MKVKKSKTGRPTEFFFPFVPTGRRQCAVMEMEIRCERSLAAATEPEYSNNIVIELGGGPPQTIQYTTQANSIYFNSLTGYSYWPANSQVIVLATALFLEIANDETTINNEITRATAAEATLTTNLNTEISNRAGAITFVETLLGNETARAAGVENNLITILGNPNTYLYTGFRTLSKFSSHQIQQLIIMVMLLGMVINMCQYIIHLIIHELVL